MAALFDRIICGDRNMCLFGTRCVVKSTVAVSVIVGVAAPVAVYSMGTTTLSYYLQKIVQTNDGDSKTTPLSDTFGNGVCDPLMTMFNAALAMGIMCILTAAAGIGMAALAKFKGIKIPQPAFIAASIAGSLMAMIGFSILASATTGGACDIFNISKTSGFMHGAGFALYVIAWLVTLVDIAVEVLVALGLLGAAPTTEQSNDYNKMEQ